jgi:hypothetical protein
MNLMGCNSFKVYRNKSFCDKGIDGIRSLKLLMKSKKHWFKLCVLPYNRYLCSV